MKVGLGVVKIWQRRNSCGEVWPVGRARETTLTVFMWEILSRTPSPSPTLLTAFSALNIYWTLITLDIFKVGRKEKCQGILTSIVGALS